MTKMADVWEQLTPQELEYLNKKFAAKYPEAAMNWVKLTLMPVESVLFLMGNSPSLNDDDGWSSGKSQDTYYSLRKKLAGEDFCDLNSQFRKWIFNFKGKAPGWYTKYD